jgi:hypothetical protein
MQEIHFEATVKDGYIKIPEGYSRLNNKKVVVDIFSKDISNEEREARVKKVKEFLQKCTGILKHTQIPSEITIKEKRLGEKYGL